MVELKRSPNTAFEERVNFAKIELDQENRTVNLTGVISSILRRMETTTRRRLRLISPSQVAGFELPLKPLLRREIQNHLEGAAQAGIQEVSNELGESLPNLRGSLKARVRTRGTTLANEITSTLERDLRSAWAQGFSGAIVDLRQLDYLTRQTFAKIAGWPEPTP